MTMMRDYFESLNQKNRRLKQSFGDFLSDSRISMKKLDNISRKKDLFWNRRNNHSSIFISYLKLVNIRWILAAAVKPLSRELRNSHFHIPIASFPAQVRQVH